MLNIYKTAKIKKHLDSAVHNPCFDKHQIAFKHMLVCGASGSGKSNFILNLIAQMQDTFAEIIIATKMVDEPAYALLTEQLKERCRVIKLEDLERLDSLKTIGQRLVVFDDFIASSSTVKEKIDEYVIRSRKRECMCVFLTQSFFATSTLIRNNVAYIVLLSLSNKKNLDLVASTVATEIDPTTLKSIIVNATKHPLNVCIIDVMQPDVNKKFRRNFFDFYQVQDERGEMVSPRLYEGSGIVN